MAEILEDIMGKGLIPADPVTWTSRRRAIVPAFHKRWLGRDDPACSVIKVDTLNDNLKSTTGPVDLEAAAWFFGVGHYWSAVFNYEFDSTLKPSKVVQAAIDTLREAEHRSMTPAPYRKIPGAMQLVPCQRAFTANMHTLPTN